MTESTPLRLYRFMSAENAIKFLESGELRVGRLRELNDPFEWLPGVTGLIESREARAAVIDADQKILSDFNDSYGIISLSTSINDPVIWSHYSDHHKGIALGFECSDSNALRKVKYSHDRPLIDLKRWFMGERPEKFVEELVGTKALSWKYEDEYRFLLDLEKCRPSGGHYFAKVEELVLADVTLGIRCPVSWKYVRHILICAGRSDVTIKLARKSLEKFRVEISPCEEA